MSLIRPTRSAQRVLCSEYIFNFNDTVVDINGATKDYGSATIASAPVADIIKLPLGAQIVGGDLVVVTAGVGPTAYTVKLGIAGNDACYLAASDLLAAANTRYALLLTTANASNAGADIRLTMVDSVAVSTAGKWKLTVLWKIDGKTDEVYPN
mgnify:CR=1 FL=1